MDECKLQLGKNLKTPSTVKQSLGSSMLTFWEQCCQILKRA